MVHPRSLISTIVICFLQIVIANSIREKCKRLADLCIINLLDCLSVTQAGFLASDRYYMRVVARIARSDLEPF